MKYMDSGRRACVGHLESDLACENTLNINSYYLGKKAQLLQGEWKTSCEACEFIFHLNLFSGQIPYIWTCFKMPVDFSQLAYGFWEYEWEPAKNASELNTQRTLLFQDLGQCISPPIHFINVFFCWQKRAQKVCPNWRGMPHGLCIVHVGLT